LALTAVTSATVMQVMNFLKILIGLIYAVKVSCRKLKQYFIAHSCIHRAIKGTDVLIHTKNRNKKTAVLSILFAR
jgi:hypothetical protein